MVLKPYFHGFPEAWSVQECGSDYGANSGLPKTFGKIQASSLPGNTQVDLRKNSTLPSTAPKTQCGWDCTSFCLVPSVFFRGESDSSQVPSSHVSSWQQVTAVSCAEDTTPVGSESALTPLQTPQNVNMQKSDLIAGLQGHQTSSRGDPCPSVRLVDADRQLAFSYVDLAKGAKDHTHLIV